MKPEERFSQIEKLLETAGKYINRHSQTIEQLQEVSAQNQRDISQLQEVSAQNQRDIHQLRLHLDETLQLFTELARYQRESQAKWEQNQAEIRRIWEHLLSQNTNGHSCP